MTERETLYDAYLAAKRAADAAYGTAGYPRAEHAEHRARLALLAYDAAHPEEAA